MSIAPSPPCRVGKVSVGFWLHPDYRRKLKTLSAHVSRTGEDLAAEALNDLFAKYGIGRVGAPQEAVIITLQEPDGGLIAALHRLAQAVTRKKGGENAP